MAPPVSIRVRSVRSHPEPLPLPAYKAGVGAGMELRADIDRAYTLAPMERLLVPTGVALILSVQYEAQLRPWPGLLLRHGVTLLNSPATLPAGSQDEIQVLLINGAMVPFTLSRGDVIAQLVVLPVLTMMLRDSMRSRPAMDESLADEQRAASY